MRIARSLPIDRVLPAPERRCPEDETLKVNEAFAKERERLLALPADAQNIAYQAILQGHTVLFATAGQLWAIWLASTVIQRCFTGCAAMQPRISW